MRNCAQLPFEFTRNDVFLMVILQILPFVFNRGPKYMSTITSMENIIAEHDKTLNSDEEVDIEEEPQFPDASYEHACFNILNPTVICLNLNCL